MRLALFTDTFLPQSNGVSRALERLVAETEARGGEARVFTVSDPRIEPSRRDAVCRVPSVRWPFHPDLRVALPQIEPLTRMMQDFRPDLVHAATPFGLGLAGLRVARSLGVPLVTSYHTNFNFHLRASGLRALAYPGWRYLRWFHDAGRRTFCPTHAVHRDLRGRGFRRLSIWGGGVDTDRFDPARRTRAMRRRLGVADDTIVVAYAGPMARGHGLDAVLTAMACMHHLRSDVVFAFAGDGPYLEHLRRATTGRAVFLGALERDGVSAFYASSNIALFPSSTDMGGEALLESIASGLPVVAADCAAAREILGAAGTFHAVGNGAQLANVLLELVVNVARRDALARVSRLRARQFNWRTVFDRLFGEYEAVLAEPARASGAVATRLRGSLAPQAPR